MLLVNSEFLGTVTELCKQAGISRSTYYRWLENPCYTKYLNDVIEKYTDAELAAVWKALLSQAKGGNVTAIKLYFDIKGKHRQITDAASVVVLAGDDEIAD